MRMFGRRDSQTNGFHRGLQETNTHVFKEMTEVRLRLYIAQTGFQHRRDGGKISVSGGLFASVFPSALAWNNLLNKTLLLFSVRIQRCGRSLRSRLLQPAPESCLWKRMVCHYFSFHPSFTAAHSSQGLSLQPSQ